MKVLLSYLYDRLVLFLGVLTLSSLAVLLFFLFSLPVGPLFYCFLILTIVGVGLFLAPDFVRYHRRAVKLEALSRLAPHLTEPVAAEGSLHQQRLMETVESLRQEVARLEGQLAGRQDELMEYYTLWAHQVKTPLAAMGLILQSNPEDSEAIRQELFKTERYVELVLGYLRIYSMNADLQLERCPVRPIAAQAVKKFAPQFIYKKLSLELEDFPNQVVTDQKWLLFMLEQIISNAAKYTERGRIRIAMDQADVLSVSDQGAGIDPADLPRVFERGFTGHNGRAESTSTGLGLYLTRRVADTLHNRIEIDSELGKGTTVRLFLGRPKPKRD